MGEDPRLPQDLVSDVGIVGLRWIHGHLGSDLSSFERTITAELPGGAHGRARTMPEFPAQVLTKVD